VVTLEPPGELGTNPGPGVLGPVVYLNHVLAPAEGVCDDALHIDHVCLWQSWSSILSCSDYTGGDQQSEYFQALGVSGLVETQAPEPLALLRDALVSEGFEASLDEVYTSSVFTSYILAIGRRGTCPSFSILSDGRGFLLQSPDGSRGISFSSVEEAAHQGFEEFGPIPSWELEKYPTLWQYLMDED
jgi:hypothetical protein